MTSSHREVAVIGASASGLLTALRLAQEGRDVSVYERASTLDPAPRTLIVTSRIRHYVKDIGDGSIVNEIKHFEMHAGTESARVTLAEPDLIVQRASVISRLAERAEDHGARFHWSKRLLGLSSGSDGIELHFGANGAPAHTVPARIIVGADGARSKVATAAKWPKQEVVPLLQAVVRRPRDLPLDTTRIWFRPQDTPYFYWLIPQSPLRAVLGVIGVDAHRVRADLDAFLAHQGLRALEYEAARIPRYQRWVPVRKKFGSGEVFLVGDAAGQVKVSTVGGLVTGFRGALGVAHAILGEGDRELRLLRWELEMHRWLRKALHSFGEHDYARLLTLLNDAGARRALGRRSRDEAVRLIVGAALAQPSVAAMLIRRLLRGSDQEATDTRSPVTDALFERWPAAQEASES